MVRRAAVLVVAMVIALWCWSCVEDEPSGEDDEDFNIGEGECVPGVDSECPLDCEDSDTWPGEWIAESQAVVDGINELRDEGASCDGEAMPEVQPLEVDSSLQEAARCHALDMAERDELTHDGADGSDEVERADDAGYPSDYVGENLAAGQESPQAAIDAWLDSETHCENLMHEHYTDTGVGAVQLEGRTYWVQIFGG